MGVIVLVDGAEFFDTFWRSVPDPTWETRWRALDPSQSAWLALMATSRGWLGTLTDPEEIELATGFHRHERRYRVCFDLAALPFIGAAATLVLVGLVPVGVLGLAAGTFGLVRSLVLYHREQQIKNAYKQAKDDYRGMTAPEPAPAS